jgi:hypothetical protein
VSGSKYAGGKVVRGAKTVGSAVRTNKLVDRAGVDTSKLSGGRAAALKAYLKRGGDDAAESIKRTDDDEVDEFADGDGCFLSAATSRVVISLADNCDPDRRQRLNEDLGEALAKFNADLPGFYRYFSSLSREDRKILLDVADLEVRDTSGADIIVRFWKAMDNNEIDNYRILTPVEAAEYIKYFDTSKGKNFEFGGEWGSRITSGNPGTFKGGSFELETAYKIDKDPDRGDVLAIGKKVNNPTGRDSDGDVWVDTTGNGKVNRMVETKNEILGEKYQKLPDMFFGDEFKNKIRIYRKSMNVDGNPAFDRVVLRFYTDDVPKEIRDIVRTAEEKYGVNIVIKGPI